MQNKTWKIIQLAIAILVATFVRIGLFEFFAIPPEVTIFSDQFVVGPRLLSTIAAACGGIVIYFLVGKAFKGDAQVERRLGSTDAIYAHCSTIDRACIAPRIKGSNCPNLYRRPKLLDWGQQRIQASNLWQQHPTSG